MSGVIFWFRTCFLQFAIQVQNLEEHLSYPGAIYIYICIWEPRFHAGETLVCPHFGLSRVIRLAASKVISLSTFWGAIFAL